MFIDLLFIFLATKYLQMVKNFQVERKIFFSMLPVTMDKFHSRLFFSFSVNIDLIVIEIKSSQCKHKKTF